MPFQAHSTKSTQIRVFSSGPLLVVDYVTAGTVESLEDTFKHQQALIASHGKISTLQIVTGAVGKIDDAVKKKAAEMTKAMENKVFGSAIVIPGTSLSAMMIRTVVTGINMVSKSSTPQKCYGTVAEALTWLQSFPGQSPEVMKIKASEIEALFPSLGKKAA
jgi:hypothetical protein